MESIRKPFTGVVNIVLFNWHFYVIAVLVIAALIISSTIIGGFFEKIVTYITIVLFSGVFISLFVSWYIYDNSDLYKLSWLNINPDTSCEIINIHAGFDETSEILKRKFPLSKLTVFDFYDPKKHTEVSIKRARKAYPGYPGTISINTNTLPLNNETVDFVFLTLGAHEIRAENERDLFFKEISRTLKPNGKIILTEHLRDFPNFLAYNIGFFHFLSKEAWKKNFENASLQIVREIKITPFVTSFTLKKNGTTP